MLQISIDLNQLYLHHGVLKYYELLQNFGQDQRYSVQKKQDDELSDAEKTSSLPILEPCFARKIPFHSNFRLMASIPGSDTDLLYNLGQATYHLFAWNG